MSLNKQLLIALAVLAFAPALAHADRSFTLTDNANGERFTCSNGGAPEPTDPSCIQQVTTYCNNNTSYGSSQCFDKASQGCSGAGPNYVECVKQTAAYCNNNTSYGLSQCFDRALPACRGSHTDLLHLMQGVRENALALQRR